MGVTCYPHEFCLSGFAIVNLYEMDRNYLIVTCILHNQENVIKSHAPIECSTTSYTSIDEDYACHHHLPLFLLKSANNLTIIDRTRVTSGTITYSVLTLPAIGNYQEDFPFFVNKSVHHLIVLGIPCL
jgi:hypothetical protein